MFVDEKKVGEPQVDTRSDLERFIAWAKTRDPKESYSYIYPEDCLIARWDRSEGRMRPRTAHEVHDMFDGQGAQIVQYCEGKRVPNIRYVGKALIVALRIQGEK